MRFAQHIFIVYMFFVKTGSILIVKLLRICKLCNHIGMACDETWQDQCYILMGSYTRRGRQRKRWKTPADDRGMWKSVVPTPFETRISANLTHASAHVRRQHCIEERIICFIFRLHTKYIIFIIKWPQTSSLHLIGVMAGRYFIIIKCK